MIQKQVKLITTHFTMFLHLLFTLLQSITLKTEYLTDQVIRIVYCQMCMIIELKNIFILS